MENPHFCLQCDDGTVMQHGVQDLAITVDTLRATVPHVAGWHCPVCGDCHFDAGEGERYGAALDALRVEADAKTAAALRATRKKLGLRQTEAGLLFGGGRTAFSQYERCKAKPPQSTILLFKLLDKHPELLRELR